MHVHYLGKIDASPTGVSIRTSACKQGEERTHLISMRVADVTCPSCRAHGIFAHGTAREDGMEPKTSRRYRDEYDSITSLSASEVERLEHYKNWHSVKFLSMVGVFLDGEADVYWLERNSDEWRAVANLLMKGLRNEALARVRTLNKRMPPIPSDVDDQKTATSIEAVNLYRRNSHRIPEYQTDRWVPSQSEFSRLSERYADVRNLDDAIAKLATPQTDGIEVSLGFLPPDMAFELAAIVAEELAGARQDWYLPKAINAACLPLPQTLVDALVQRVASLAPASSRTIVIKIGGSGDSSQPEPDIHGMLLKAFDGYNWMDPSVFAAAAHAADLSVQADARLMEMANGLDAVAAQTLRRLASRYRMPRGIVIREEGVYRAVSYREICAMIGGEFSEARRLALGWIASEPG